MADIEVANARPATPQILINTKFKDYIQGILCNNTDVHCDFSITIHRTC